jgi:hypothetical protein
MGVKLVALALALVLAKKEEKDWFTALVLGGQWMAPRSVGVEASLLRATLDGHATGAGGGVLGLHTAGAYLEAEACLVLTPHNDLAAKLGHEYPMFFITAGAGPAVRWSDGAVGLQTTVSLTFMIFPQIFFRHQVWRGDRPVTTGGMMIKLPVPVGE